MTQIPLFPLAAVLFPAGRMPIQVFEQRYLEMIKRCLRESAGFGVVQILEGSEVYRSDRWREPKLAPVGCYARIVDWDGLPGGRLGVVLEGEQRIAVGATSMQTDRLVLAECERMAPDPATPMPAQFAELVSVLEQLVRHPAIERLRFELDTADASRTGLQLAQLLPLANDEKQSLLELDDPLERLQRLADRLAELGGR